MRAILVVIVVLLLSFWIGVKNPKKVLYAAVFMAPWQGVDVDVGLRVTGFLVLISGLVGAVLALNIRRRMKKTPIEKTGLILGILFYATVWSIAQIPFLESRELAGGVLRSAELRAISQILMFWLTVSPIFLVPAIIKNIEDLVKMGRIYLISVFFLATVGWLQLIVWRMTGSDPTPIGFFSNLLTGVEEHRSGIMVFKDSIIYRMSSLAGEPKGLANALVVGLALIQTGLRPKGNKGLWLWLYFFAAMIATFSTMGFVMWFVASVFQLFLASRQTLQLSKIIRVKPVTVALGIFLIPVAAGLIFYTESGKNLTEIIEQRTVDRAQESEHGLMEEYNVAVYEFLKEKPWIAMTGVGLGNVHLYAYPYLPMETLYYTKDAVFVAKSPILRWVSEVGIITLLILIVWSFGRLRRATAILSSRKETRDIADGLAKFFPLIMLIWFMGYAIPEFFLSLGMLLAIPLISKHHVYISVFESGSTTSTEIGSLLSKKSNRTLPDQKAH